MKFTIFFLIFIYNTVTALVCTNITSNPILPIGCTTIGGTLNLNSITQTELLKFSNITTIDGNLYLYRNSNLISLDGIQSITTVTGKFWLGITVRWIPGRVRTRHDDRAPNSNLNCSNVCNQKIIANLKNSGASEIAAQCSVQSSFICPFSNSTFQRNSCAYNTTCNSICDETTCDFTAPIQRRCGDGIKDIEEECDSLQNNETECAYGDRNCQPCNSTCNILPGPGYCGDNIIDTENGEECDEEQGSLDCQYGERSCRVCISSVCKYTNGNLYYCGDGKVDTGFEECDNTTSTQCSYGTICEVCSNCTHVNQTGSYCGDNVVDTENEECDEQPISGDCNYGEPFCSICNSSSCKFVPGNVVGYCGDNKVDVVNGEQCDNETDIFCRDCLVVQNFQPTSDKETFFSSSESSKKSTVSSSKDTSSVSSKKNTVSSSKDTTSVSDTISNFISTNPLSTYKGSISLDILDNCNPNENCTLGQNGENWIITYEKPQTFISDLYLNADSSIQVFGNFSARNFTIETGVGLDSRVNVEGCFIGENSTFNLDLNSDFPQGVKTEVVIVSSGCIIGNPLITVEASYQTSADPCIITSPVEGRTIVAILVEYEETPCVSGGFSFNVYLVTSLYVVAVFL